MKKLISVITDIINEQIKTGEINMIRLESFDSPIIYKSICENLSINTDIHSFVPKLTLEKYQQFSEDIHPEWNKSLAYLHQGRNSNYSETLTDEYIAKSFIDFSKAITKWRNESPNMELNKTSLILLMGTEAAPDDAGSLKDTTFVISPHEIITWLSKDYSDWFTDILKYNAIDTREVRNAINTLYKTIFSSVNVNIFKLSDFIDTLYDMSFATAQELVDYICETLNTTWAIPSVIERSSVPKVTNLSKGKMSSAKIITSAIRFINRYDDIPTASALKKLDDKFKKYVVDNELDCSKPFPEDTAQFKNFDEFSECVKDFMRGINLSENREKLLLLDYAIINKINGARLASKHSQTIPTVTGSPMEVYSKMFLDVCDEFNTEYSSYPTSFTVRVEKISLPNCIEDQKEDSFISLCNFMGGILSFIQTANIELDYEQVSFEYDNNIDPFDFANYPEIKSIVKGTGKWGDPCKIQFKITAQNDEKSHKYEYKWLFSPYSAWYNAFTLLGTSLFTNTNDYSIPSMVVCDNIQDYLRCESEEEFYSQLSRINAINLNQNHKNELKKYFGAHNRLGIFTALCCNFEEFTRKLTQHGFFNALGELRQVVQEYTNLMDYIRDNFKSFTDVQQEKITLLVNSFVISSNREIIENCDVSEVLLPAYHPVMLEKIDAQQLFMREGISEIFAAYADEGFSADVANAKLDTLVQLSSITQGVDVIYRKSSSYLTCKNMWEYFGVYFNADTSNTLISSNAFGDTMVTDDDEVTAMLQATPLSNVVVRNILDYIRTFPARIDGLNVAFIAPLDMQHIVAAVHLVAKELEKSGVLATINLKIVCINSKKNSSSYLKRWLDSYFDDERNVKVNTFLRNVTIGAEKTDADCLEEILQNSDLCFNYDVLKSIGVQFDRTDDNQFDKEQAKFPMTFTPDTIAATQGKSRKLSISQFQFLASKSHTQANFIIGNKNSFPGVYRTFKMLELTDIESYIIDMTHRTCKWVVCIDSSIDRRMLESKSSRIIGFTTGEGSYGELNVTVSARNDILTDIKAMLKKRVREKFSNWGDDRLEKAVNFCVDEMSKYMDGSRVLKALNPYDYEIHNFLAYILTLQMLEISQPNENYAVRTLISLDSYKHWFSEDYDTNKDNKRPDFMLIEIPKSENNLDPEKPLEIKAKIIECKMGFENDKHIEKALTQLEKGLRTMSVNWNPDNGGIMHRYWLNQLYRVIIFSPLNLDDTSEDYNTIRNKIYGILSGNYKIDWTGDIFAFWLDSDNENHDISECDSELQSELADYGVNLDELLCHQCGQLFIQKMLVPPDERTTNFTPNVIFNTDNLTFDDIDEDDDIITEAVEITEFRNSEIVPVEQVSITDEKEEMSTDINAQPQNEQDKETTESYIAPTPENELMPSSPVEANACENEKPPLSSVRLLLGEDLRTKEKYYWEFGNKNLNNRHLMINGNSGCGKTYCIQALLMEMVKSGVSGIIFDYTSGFTLDKLDPIFVNELGDRIKQRIVYLEKIPVNPFAKQTVKVGGIEVPEDDTIVATRVANVFKSVYNFGDQQNSALYKAIRSGLQRHKENMSFAYLEDELNNVNQKQAETVLSKIQPFLDLAPFAENETFNWGDIRDSDGMVYVMQLDGFDRPTQLLLTELLLWDIWNYCVKSGNEDHPLVIVMDEAQNLSHAEGSPSEKILTEGRKFGISGWYATQFMKPQLSDDEIQRLQQAGQKLYFCPPDDGVMTVAKSIDIDTHGSREWAQKLKSLKKGECVTCGNMLRNERWSKYEPRAIKITSLQERIKND